VLPIFGLTKVAKIVAMAPKIRVETIKKGRYTSHLYG